MRMTFLLRLLLLEPFLFLPLPGLSSSLTSSPRRGRGGPKEDTSYPKILTRRLLTAPPSFRFFSFFLFVRLLQTLHSGISPSPFARGLPDPPSEEGMNCLLSPIFRCHFFSYSMDRLRWKALSADFLTPFSTFRAPPSPRHK